ncbi:lytic transglycosylase domain-containing protein [Agrobacterium tumefaciens]|uniref:lytic transglycosylase domain-containing protein n=1 Tax=Agrobacterium tumefaciens TaxID=358 RepID=UPI001572604A|nr:lytic transglycosylase domain-containing protein [Agrobacterium tumefaciens]NTB05929.1 lytic transglycosylase domain-containing protein [Agrobacterium tumefaciens]
MFLIPQTSAAFPFVSRRLSCLASVLAATAFVWISDSHAADSGSFLARCAPKVHAETLGAIVRTESSGHMFVLSDDGPRTLPWSQRRHMLRSFRPDSLQEAADLARELIARGHLVGIGLTQVSSQHLPRLGVSLEQLFDPCTNLAVGGQILQVLYNQALREFPDEQTALRAAISAFNTGNFEGGIKNGYVARVIANARAGVPELRAPTASTGRQEARRATGLQQPRKQRPAVEQKREVILPAYEGIQRPLLAGGSE